MQLPELMTAEEVAAILHVPVVAIYRMTKTGEIAAVRLSPKRLRYEPTEVERFISAGRAAA